MKKNLVLIGMPGSGKTKVGEELSRRLNMPVVDTDHMIEQEQGRSIPEIFSRDGEPAFRDMETAAVRRAAAMEGVIIATGGGMVLREENMQALAETGVIFFRNRELAAIVGENHEGRPLIGEDKQRIYRLYDQRIGLYNKYAQFTISNTDTVEEAAEQIEQLYRKEYGQ